MALTNGAKKFLGLIVTVAVVGGGIYGYKDYKAKNPTPVTEEVVAEQAPIEVPQPINSPIAQAERMDDIVAAPEQEEPAPAPTHNASSNRGLANVMNAAGNK
jgi:hypothetical protein